MNPLLFLAAAPLCAMTGSLAVTSVGDLPVTNGLPITIQAGTPVRSAGIEAAHVMKFGAGKLFHYEITNTGAAPAYAMILDAAAVPKAGAVSPVHCAVLAPGQTAKYDARALAESYANGIVAVLSSGGACFGYTPYAAGFFEGLVQ